MNTVTVTKTQLKEYIDAKISKRKRELHEEIRAVVADRLSIKLTTLLGDMKELERVASKFEDLLAASIHAIGGDYVPSYAAITSSNAGRLCKAHKYFLDEIVAKATDAMLASYSKAFRCTPFVDEFNALNQELQTQIKLYKTGLATLRDELHNAIALEANGKRAYNALVALGVDMSDLPEGTPNLPAVVKLSVDVCALNGNCSEKTA